MNLAISDTLHAVIDIRLKRASFALYISEVLRKEHVIPGTCNVQNNSR